MEPNKLEFCNDAMRRVCDLCKLLFNLKTDQEVDKVFGVSQDELEKVIRKIISSLPDTIFNHGTQKLEEIKSIFAKEFIFFQVQEKLDDPHYQDDLIKFTYIFSRDIQRTIEADIRCSAKTEEE